MSATHLVWLAKKNEAMIEGKVKMDWAKINGIMPAMLTIRGKDPFTDIDIRVPTRRPGYMTGIFRRPCWTTMIIKMVEIVMTTIKRVEKTKFSRSAMTLWIVAGMRDTIPEKIIRDRPWLRMPYSEINSPNQMANIVPAVMLATIASEGSRFSAVQPKL